MYYSIVTDRPTRFRVRCGKYVFNKEEATGIVHNLKSIPGVRDVKCHTANGSILILHEPHVRAEITEQLNTLNVACLPQINDDAEFDAEYTNNKYQLKFLGNTISYIFRKFLPPPIRTFITCMHAVSYIQRGIRSLVRNHIGVEVLDATAVGLTLARRQFKTAASIMFMMELSDLLVAHTQARTRNALRSNLLMVAENVWVVSNGIEIEVKLNDVNKGDIVRVRTGSMIPVDGTIVDGLAQVNQSSMTGESTLITKKQSDTVYAGTIVDDGFIDILVKAVPGQSRIDRIVQMVEQSQELKASVQTRAEILADKTVPMSLALFAAVLVLTRNITKAMSVLMVDYACAIKLSAPIAVMTATQEAAKEEIIVKGGRFLEAFAKADTIVFDKTGTLTQAAPKVEKVISTGELSEKEVLRIAACLEEHFPHSIARAVVNYASEQETSHYDEAHAEVEYISAHGISSTIGGKRACIGSAHFIFDDENVEMPEGLSRRLEKEASATSRIFLSINDKLEGVLCISDPLRAESVKVVSGLKNCEFNRVVMLTGDSDNVAKVIADEVGIAEYKSQILPDEKATYINKLKDEGHTVVMVGDGINDSPGLAAADVSVALSDATDVAKNVADISIKGESLESLLYLRGLSQAMMHHINRSYDFIVGFNSALIVLSLAGILNPASSAFLHNSSTVCLAYLNSRFIGKKRG